MSFETTTHYTGVNRSRYVRQQNRVIGLSSDGKYEKILVTRPVMPLGRDIGYLPGSMEEKLSHWMQPIFDNLKFLLSGRIEHLFVHARRSRREGVHSME